MIKLKFFLMVFLVMVMLLFILGRMLVIVIGVVKYYIELEFLLLLKLDFFEYICF